MDESVTAPRGAQDTAWLWNVRVPCGHTGREKSAQTDEGTSESSWVDLNVARGSKNQSLSTNQLLSCEETHKPACLYVTKLRLKGLNFIDLKEKDLRARVCLYRIPIGGPLTSFCWVSVFPL